MINFYLPGFSYENIGFYEGLLLVKEEHPEYFRGDFRIAGLFDAFPPSIWNGGRVIQGHVTEEEAKYIVDHVNSLGIAMRYTFTNTELSETDVYDRYCNNIMKLSDNGKNEVIIYDDNLENYLREHYPNFKYILTITKFKSDYEEINKLTKKYDFVIPSYELTWDVNFLNKLEDKDKIEILVNCECVPDCPVKNKHYNLISKRQLNFLDNIPLKCEHEDKMPYYNYECNFKTYLKPDFVWNTLVPMGFSNFKIKGREYKYIEKLIHEVLKYTVKEEYFNEVFEYFLVSIMHKD